MLADSSGCRKPSAASMLQQAVTTQSGNRLWTLSNMVCSPIDIQRIEKGAFWARMKGLGKTIRCLLTESPQLRAMAFWKQSITWALPQCNILSMQSLFENAVKIFSRADHEKKNRFKLRNNHIGNSVINSIMSEMIRKKAGKISMKGIEGNWAIKYFLNMNCSYFFYNGSIQFL
jgi:hypothetical protein